MTNTSPSCPVSTAARWAVSPATMSFATCSGSPCCRCASSGTLLCWTLVLGVRFTRRDGTEPSLRLVKRPREPSKRSTVKGFIHRSPRIGVPSWMPRDRWCRFPRHFIISLGCQHQLEFLHVEREYHAVCDIERLSSVCVRPIATTPARDFNPTKRKRQSNPPGLALTCLHASASITRLS